MKIFHSPNDEVLCISKGFGQFIKRTSTLFAKIIFLEVVASFDCCIMNFYYPLFQTKLKEIQNNFANDFFLLYTFTLSLSFSWNLKIKRIVIFLLSIYQVLPLCKQRRPFHLIDLKGKLSYLITSNL